jgi:hypothetical protein
VPLRQRSFLFNKAAAHGQYHLEKHPLHSYTRYVFQPAYYRLSLNQTLASTAQPIRMNSVRVALGLDLFISLPRIKARCCFTAKATTYRPTPCINHYLKKENYSYVATRY